MNKKIIILVTVFIIGVFVVLSIISGINIEKVIGAPEKKQQNILVEENERVQVDSVTVLFGGDMMFDRYIRQANKTREYDNTISSIKKIFNESDCVVANLEGPVTENESVSIGSEFGSPDNYRFTFEPAVVQTLQRNNFCIVSLGNNHIDNFGIEGIMQTKDFLRDAGVHYFGDTDIEEEQRSFIQDFNGVRIAFINYNKFTKDSLKHVLEDVQEVKDKSDFIVAYMHWGQEYQTMSDSVERDIAHQFIDSGVDVIIGSHPHVVQDKEIYRGKTVYYSLGNFVFDQYFSEETKKGLIVAATFNIINNNITFEEHTIKLTPSGTTLLVQ